MRKRITSHSQHWPARVCMLGRFSWVWLFVTVWTVAHQAPLSMGISRQEYWSGLPVASSRGSSLVMDWTHISYISCIGRGILYHECHLTCTPITSDSTYGCCPSDAEKKRQLCLPNTPGAPPHMDLHRGDPLPYSVQASWQSYSHLSPHIKLLEADTQVQLWVTALLRSSREAEWKAVTSTTQHRSLSPFFSCHGATK